MLRPIYKISKVELLWKVCLIADFIHFLFFIYLFIFLHYCQIFIFGRETGHYASACTQL